MGAFASYNLYSIILVDYYGKGNENLKAKQKFFE